MVLVDTTVWLDFLRNHDTKSVAQLKKLLQVGDAAIAPVILQELLQGASNPENFEKLRIHFTALPTLRPKGDTTHIAAAALYARCRWRGITPRSPHDCLIAQLCVEHKMPLLHDDRDFEMLASVEPKLKLVPRE